MNIGPMNLQIQRISVTVPTRKLNASWSYALEKPTVYNIKPFVDIYIYEDRVTIGHELDQEYKIKFKNWNYTTINTFNLTQDDMNHFLLLHNINCNIAIIDDR